MPRHGWISHAPPCAEMRMSRGEVLHSFGEIGESGSSEHPDRVEDGQAPGPQDVEGVAKAHQQVKDRREVPRALTPRVPPAARRVQRHR